jgi:radical SAM protein with 4Fe4S-binding SPASM domain
MYMQDYLKIKEVKDLPRLPLEGNLDLTYRCNNNCRHCWLRIPKDSPERQEELTYEEIKKIVNDARKLGCRKWSISGGEPMLRPDFAEIFDFITKKCISYSLNTNGTLITPKIASLMKRKGSKMIAVYGATAEVHDHITRNPGSFEATMQGLSYMKEAGASFVVQLIPMRDNYHQFREMVSLAESLSSEWKIGAAWLYLSACGDPERNEEIIRQRLDPKDVIELDKPDLSYEALIKDENSHCWNLEKDDRLFASCIATRRDFHIDPYGNMTFCCFIKDPLFRYDLKKGSFKECWEKFIPTLPDKARGGNEYAENCGSCELKAHCRWCPTYSYLENGRFTAKVDYLCSIAEENKKFKEDWGKNHRRYYKIADMTIQVDSDLPITDHTFHPKFKRFEADGPGEDILTIRHHFALPDLNGQRLGKKVYRKAPWAVYKKENSWIYLGISPEPEDKHIHRVAVFNQDHTRAQIYNENEEDFHKGGLNSLTLFPTDQILLASVLADKKGCYMHSAGVILEGRGLLFMGHSDAGKSTIVTMLREKAEILCDDRMIVRRHPEGFMVHGTWSHGDIPEVSPRSAPLEAIFFLEKDTDNRLEAIRDRRKTIGRLLGCLIKPLGTADWWDKMLSLQWEIAREIPCYFLHFDKSGKVADLLKAL